MQSLDRMLALLDAFTLEAPMWTSEALIKFAGTSPSTAYRYLKSLQTAGLLSRAMNGSYVLGPRVPELDRTARLTDPVLLAGQPVIEELSKQTQQSAVLFILYRDTVICVGAAYAAHASPDLFTRGQRRPLFSGASAKAILAWLPPHQLRSLYTKYAVEIERAGLGKEWGNFRNMLRSIRLAGYASSFGEYTSGVASIAAPIFNSDQIVLGSLALARSMHEESSANIDSNIERVKDAAQRISQAISTIPVSSR